MIGYSTLPCAPETEMKFDVIPRKLLWWKGGGHTPLQEIQGVHSKPQWQSRSMDINFDKVAIKSEWN